MVVMITKSLADYNLCQGTSERRGEV